MNPTDEQAHILDIATTTKSNIIINALAGTGKTSTLEMLEQASKEKPILYLVFNKKNAQDAEKKMAGTTTVRTLNALGHRIWAAKCGKVSLNAKKTQDILKVIINEFKKADQAEIWLAYYDIISAVGLAKSLGYIPEGKFTQYPSLISRQEFHHFLDETPSDIAADIIDECLTRSIIAGFEGNIDYNDQCYLPAIFGGTYPKFPRVLVDEAQDLSPVNHKMVSRLITRRFIAVGDPFQNIYGFRGAKAGSMSTLQQQYAMCTTELSISFRCPSEIVKNARWRAPQFKWSREGGHVEILDSFNSRDFPDDATILCRNNAPLFGVAFRLLASGRSVSVAGSDIGPKLIGQMRKLGPDDMTRTQSLGAISEWLDERLENNSKQASDLAECMRVFVNATNSLSGAISYAEHLFAQKGSIQLLTGHKAKGLEWPTVYHLDPWILKDNEQDMNLRYVIQTRSSDRYFEIDSAKIKW